ncbi:MAG: hypothetical protein NC433_14985 [Clostridiales bacterium]|nr:hypothetical protein [Clostridiales bacterium]
MKKGNLWKKGILGLGMAAAFFAVLQCGISVYATETEPTTTEPIEQSDTTEASGDKANGASGTTGVGTGSNDFGNKLTESVGSPVATDDDNDEEKEKAKEDIQNYKHSLEIKYSMSDAAKQKLKNICDGAIYYIDTMENNEGLKDYVAKTKSEMESAATTVDNSKTDKTESAATTTNDTNRTINDDDRGRADEEMFNYKRSLEIRYSPNDVAKQKLEDIFSSAVWYIANTDMTLSELDSYVSETKGKMESAAVETVSATTSEFLRVGDNWVTPTVSYGQSVSIVLPVINFGTDELNDLIIEPQVSSVVAEWPFALDKTSYLQTEYAIPGNETYEAALFNRREFTFIFTAREDVMTGYYPLKFNVWYTKAGVRCEEPAQLTVYVHTIGKPGSGNIGGSSDETSNAKPRIVVTGFETNPEQVYAGDTFVLTIHVKNTSKETPVTNLLFDMQAATEGEDKTNTYAAFLPTSGASSVYMDRIGVNTEADIVIEMSAKADLAQKPYVLDVNMKYDAGSMFDLTDTASVSIPIYQESRFDISTPEVVPGDITVGSQSNIMFSIYNTGKTTLYNTQVKFEADSIEEASAFVGNLTSGATGNVDVMVTGRSGTMDDGTINVNISYEDDAGNVTVETRTVTLYVYEEFYDDMMMGDDIMMGGDMMMEEEPKSNKGVIIAIVVVAVIAVVIVAIVIFIKIRKKKKAAALLADDLMSIDKD